MADNAQVQPVQGNPAPPVAQPAPIPRRQQRFRAAAQPGNNVAPAQIPAFPVSQGIAPILSYTDGYVASEVPMSGLNTLVPSYVNVNSRVFLTNQRLSANDKFLKETNMYHPDALDMYISFLFIYHILRVRAQVGSLTVQEDTLLSNLRTNYPESGLPIPGTVVDCFQAITATENPYSWLGNIATAMPANTNYQGGNHGYILQNDFHLILPCIPMLVRKITALCVIVGAPTDANVTTLNTLLHGLDHAAVQTGQVERFWLQTPHARFPGTLTTRVATAFKNAVHGQAAAPFLNEYSLDLPRLQDNTHGANMDLTAYMGIIDAPGVANRRMQYLRWPVQLANMVATACKYISGSRHLSDIPTTGLGAMTPVSTLVPNTLFETRDPDDVQGGNAALPFTVATVSSYYVPHMNATLMIRDPVISDLAVQYAMITQVNVDFSNCLNGDATPSTNPALAHSGPFWGYPTCETGPEAAVANILVSHLPNFVRSNPRRDAAE